VKCVKEAGSSFLHSVLHWEELDMEQVRSSDGTPIAVWRSGAGRPLLLVHGTTADHQRWAAISSQLEQNFTVYAMDRRGRGASGDAPDYDLMREAEDVAAVVETIDEPVSILGHSFGAICSLEATLLTDKVSRLILYEPPIPTGLPAYPPGAPDRMQGLVHDGELEAALEIFFREVVRMPENEFAVFRQLPVWKVRVSLAPTIPREMVFDRSYTFNAQKVADLTMPVLLLLGGDSPPLFGRGIEAVDAALPNSQVVVLPGQQHVAMDTNPELFLEEVLRFLLA
jgi:pimeloyl-ACP methyl ester carboxylesterase